MSYHACGVAIESDLPLELPTVDRAAELVVRELAESVDEDTIEWFDDRGGNRGADRSR